MVMCSEPMTFLPLSGLSLPYLARQDMSPGISFSASCISLRPQSASFRSATLYFSFLSTGCILFLQKLFFFCAEQEHSEIPFHRIRCYIDMVEAGLAEPGLRYFAAESEPAVAELLAQHLGPVALEMRHHAPA